MDLTSLYSDFVMDGREMLFHSTPGGVSSFHDNEGNVYCAVPAFQHLVSLGTRCQLTAALLVLKNWSYLVRWSWPEPPRTTSKSLFRTPLVAPLWMQPHRWFCNMWWALPWDPLLISRHLYQRPTWSELYAEIRYNTLWLKDATLTGRRLIQYCSDGRMLIALIVRCAMDWSRWICRGIYDIRTRPVSVSGDALFRAVRRGLLQRSLGKTTWRRCIISRWLLISRVLAPIWPGVVRTTLFLWSERHDRPGAMDGSCAGTEGRSGTA